MKFFLAAGLAVPVRSPAAGECGPVIDLAHAEQRLLAYNHDVLLAREATNAAGADLKVAGERPNPTVSLGSSSYDVHKGLGPGSWYDKQVDTVLRLEQPIERGGKRDLRQTVARHGIHAAEADYADQKRQSLLALRQGYYDLQLAEQKLVINREIAGLQAATVSAAERRLKAGDISRTDLARLKVEALKADNDVRQAEADVHAAGVALSYLIGCPADGNLSAAGEWPTPAVPPEETAVPVADRRPDVVAAQARQAQAHSALDLAKSQQVHDISVSLQYEHYPNGVPTPGNGDVLLGFGVSVPLYLFHAYEGEVARAVSDESTRTEALARAQAQAASEIAKANQDLTASAERERRYHDEILPRAEQAAEAIEYAFSRGAVPLLDLLDARRTLRATRIEAATAQSDYAKALAAWKAATETYATDDVFATR